MFTRPADLSDADVTDALRRGWGIDVDVGYRAVGFGSHHWLATGDERWFVTVDDLRTRARDRDEPLDAPRERLSAALRTALALSDAGHRFVVAPVPSRSGEVTLPLLGSYAIALYPFVDGETHPFGSYPSHATRSAVVALIAELHSSAAHCRETARRDDLTVPHRDTLFEAIDGLDSPLASGPFGEPARELLRQHARGVAHAFDRYDALASEALRQPERFVLTHGEPHQANTITTDRGVVLIDWDTTLIAPPERDLWNLVAEDPLVADEYAALTDTTVDHDTIELYRLAWDLAEIAIYVTELRAPHVESDDTREAWTNLQHYLDPARWRDS